MKHWWIVPVAAFGALVGYHIYRSMRYKIV